MNCTTEDVKALVKHHASCSLKPFQVGENDIVLAHSEDEAAQLLADYTGMDKEDLGEVDDLSNRLDMALHHEDGKFLMTLGEFIQDKTDPQYLVGWE